MPLSTTYDTNAIMTPNSAKNTQSSPRRANVRFHIHDETFSMRDERLPSNSCKDFPALLLYKRFVQIWIKIYKY